MIFIVIPVYNRINFTRQCLISLGDQTNKNFKIIVVDDGSRDGTYEIIQKEFKEVIVIQTEGDLFWTKAVNIGIRKALENNASYVITLNNDTIIKNDFIEKLLDTTKKHPTALQGAAAIDFNTKNTVYSGARINWKKASFIHSDGHLNEKSERHLNEVDHFPGRGLLIPSEVFREIGLFDEDRFPHYFADYDFTYRAYKNGFKIYCNSEVEIYIFPEESGDQQNRIRKSLKSYFNHLYGIKGGGNLRNFTLFAFSNCPRKYLVQFLAIGYAKRLFGYFIN